MKLCPVCQRCFEDTDGVCSFDQTALVPYRHGSRMISEKYRLDRLLGRGGMGAVYSGTHVDLERPVAIKLLLPDFTADQDALERFRREARAAARLNHPHVADTYDYGSLPEGGAYIVMELIEGQTLRERMDKTGMMPFAEAITIARQVASGVEAAHRSGITHRDLKPSNIILTMDHDGRLLAKVVDFSVAKLKEGTTSGAALTATGSLIGTPRYMAPEQCADNKADARSDIYSMGVILYEMIAGRAPFEGPTTTAIAIKHIQETPTPVEELRPDTPPSLRKLIAESLAKAPSDRPQSAQQFSARLDEAARELPPSAFEELPAALAEALAGAVAERETAQINPKTTEIAPETGRTGEPTLEEAEAEEQQPADAPSVQSYAVMPGEDEEVETRVTPKEATKEEESAASVAKEGAKNEAALTQPAIAFGDAARTASTQAETDFPLLSRHKKPARPAPSSSTQRVEEPQTLERKASSTYLPYIAGAALILIVGLGVLWLTMRQPATSRSENVASSSNLNRNATAAQPADRTISNSNSSSPALSDANAAATPASQRDARAELKSLRDQWVDATIARDINRLLSFYPPVMDTFYLRRNVPLSSVRAEKQRMIEQATTIEIQTSEPEISLSGDGRTASMTFRKSWNFRGAQNSSGEVIQELRWQRTGDGWKITSERDTAVIR